MREFTYAMPMIPNASNASQQTRRLRAIASSKEGLTLVEIMVAIGLLGMSSFGLLSGLLQSRQMAEAAIHQGTALAIAQGYLEQIKSMEFDSLDDEVLPTLFNQGESDTLSVSPTPADVALGDPNSDIPNIKRIDINNTPEVEQDDLEMRITVYVDDLTDDPNGIGESRRIVLKYQYLYSDGYRSHTERNALYTIRSEVPTY